MLSGRFEIPRLRARFACATFGMTLAASAGAQQATPPAQPNAPALDLTAVSLPVPAAGKLVAITNASMFTASNGWIQSGYIVIRDG
jgi:hypothetical protein